MNIINAIKGIDWRNVLERAFWTFLQVFLAAFVLAGESFIDLIFNANWSGLMTLVMATTIAGISAGFSALKTFVFELWATYKPRLQAWLKSKRG